jgi:hypothetical protein
MSYIILQRESNNFKDVLSDPVIKRGIRLKMSFKNHLILDFSDDQTTSYFMLKYGDDVISMSHIVPDRTPIPNRDYVPERKKRTLH